MALKWVIKRYYATSEDYRVLLRENWTIADIKLFMDCHATTRAVSPFYVHVSLLTSTLRQIHLQLV